MNHDGTYRFLLLVVVALAPVAYYYAQVARRKRQHLAFQLRRAAVYFACVVIGFYSLTGHGYSTWDAGAFSVVLGLAAAFILVRSPRSDRRIPKRIRQAVIARDLKGKRFDPNLRDIDHIVPYSKGGDHSIQNLRVMAKSANRSRGAKMPKFQDFR